MPARYWLPLPELREPAAVEHLHAAVSAWFDGDPDGDPSESSHHEVVKPYTISPTSRRGGRWGIEVSTLTDEAAHVVEQNAGRVAVRLGARFTTVGRAQLLRSSSWQQLADPDRATRWVVEFVTPFTYRSRNRTSPFPIPPVLLRSPAVAWARYSQREPLSVAVTQHHAIWVSSIDVNTEGVVLKGRTHPGLLGRVTYRCDDEVVTPVVSTLFRLAEFTGVGSFRGKGMGIVAVTAA